MSYSNCRKSKKKKILKKAKVEMNINNLMRIEDNEDNNYSRLFI